MIKKLLLVSIVATLFLTWCSQQPINENKIEENNEQIKETRYENKQYRLKLDFPTTRTFKENVYGSTVIFFAPEQEGKKTRENLSIKVQLISSWANLESLYEQNKETMKSLAEDLTIVKEKDLKIDNYPAKQIKYKFSQEGFAIQQELTMVLKWETLYIINYTATQKTFDDYKKDVDTMLKDISIR